MAKSSLHVFDRSFLNLLFLGFHAERSNGTLLEHECQQCDLCDQGEGLVQIVGTSQRTVFSGRVHEDQILIVPQNFAVLKQAGRNGFEWVAFKTNDNAMTTPLAGKTSALTPIPLDVLVYAYQGLSREEALNLKNNRRWEVQIFSPYSHAQEGREST